MHFLFVWKHRVSFGLFQYFQCLYTTCFQYICLISQNDSLCLILGGQFISFTFYCEMFTGDFIPNILPHVIYFSLRFLPSSSLFTYFLLLWSAIHSHFLLFITRILLNFIASAFIFLSLELIIIVHFLLFSGNIILIFNQSKCFITPSFHIAWWWDL